MPGVIEINVLQGEFAGCPPLDCEGCLPSFSPLPDSTYIVSAWAKEEGVPAGTILYTKPRITIDIPGGEELLDFFPRQGTPMVEGWQLMDSTFTMPSGGGGFRMRLHCEGEGTVLFDDVRIFPANGSMKSYVYDPENLRFVAELDERHFATFYEYDNEGRLVRVKKETERGIMTLKETRQNAPAALPSIFPE